MLEGIKEGTIPKAILTSFFIYAIAPLATLVATVLMRIIVFGFDGDGSLITSLDFLAGSLCITVTALVERSQLNKGNDWLGVLSFFCYGFSIFAFIFFVVNVYHDVSNMDIKENLWSGFPLTSIIISGANVVFCWWFIIYIKVLKRRASL